jgi:RimJ/RimL family protein N-acetyltransferase
MNMNLSFLTGRKVKLTALAEHDLNSITMWYQDTSFLRLFDATPAFPKSALSLRTWFDSFSSSSNQFVFAIRTIENDHFIGFVELDGIIWNKRVSGIAIAIGEENNRGKGYGHDALQLILKFAFHELNLRRVQLTVFSYNKPATRLYKKIGFTHEGTYREFLERDGETHDLLLFGMLRHEWEQNLL